MKTFLFINLCVALMACVTTRRACPVSEPKTIVVFVTSPAEIKAEQDLDAGSVVREEEKEQTEPDVTRFDPLNGEL